MGEDGLDAGDVAPDFCLPDKDEKMVCLKDLRGNWVVLYFYPKDNTSACTKEAINFTKNLSDFESIGAVVLGISPDSPLSHRKFSEKNSLNIILLSDREHKVVDRYGVWQLKKRYGRDYYGVVRSTFLIDPKGRIKRVWRRVRVEGHVEEVKGFLNGLEGNQTGDSKSP